MPKPTPKPEESPKQDIGSNPVVAEDSDNEEKNDGMGMKLAAAALGGMGLAATATFLLMKNQQN